MAIEDVVARLRVEGEGPFAQAFGRARDAMRGVSQEGEQSERDLGKGAKALAVAGGAALVARKGYQGLKSAIDTTNELAKSTAAFSRASGLSKKDSQAWITVAKTRGIETGQLQMGMAAFGRQLGATGKDGAASSKALAQLGIDQKALLGMPMADRMAHVANAFKGMPDGVDKAAAAQRLFGRSGQQLLPVLNAGAEGLQDQLDTASKLVPPLDKSGNASLDMAKKQREMEMAMLGVKTSIASALIPILSTLVGAVTPVITGFSELIQKSPILTGIVVGLGGAFVGLLIVAKIATAIKALTGATWLVTAAKAAWAAVTWILNGALAVLTSPITLVILAIVAFVAAIAAAIYFVVKNFDSIRAAIVGAFNAVKSGIAAAAKFVGDQVSKIVGFVSSLPGKIAGVAKGLFTPIVNAAKDAAMFAWKQFVWLVDQIKTLPAKISGFIGSLGSSVGNALKESVKSVLPGPLADLLATGGIVAAQTGLAAGGGKNVLVGERGPEMLSLPSGSRVTPLPPPTLAASQLGTGDRPIVTQVFLDRHQIATAIASFAADQQAAR